jgi:uncharacterized protein YjbI with pentapeptide repeats
LRRANLSESILSRSNFSESNLAGADLSRAILNKANLTKAQLSSSLLIGIREYDDLECNQAYFDYALIDNQQLIDYLSENGALELPEILHDRDELKLQLKIRHFSEEQIKSVLQRSILD